MKHLTRADLWSLEEYAEQRPGFRARVMEHKLTRQLGLGDNARLYFEDVLTIKYQVQEMLRIEKVFEADGINEELEAYNPLIPDGHNWKATFMLEFEDPEQRAERLAQLVGIEDQVWLRVDGYGKVYPFADEDMDRDNQEKTSSVHFLRFELTPVMIAALQTGAGLSVGIEHPAYFIAAITVPGQIRASLINDLQAATVN